jgi:hypothetical protein
MNRVESQSNRIEDSDSIVVKEPWIPPAAMAQKVQDITAASNVTFNLADLGTCAS